MSRLLIMTNDICGGGVERVAYVHSQIFSKSNDFELAVLLCEPRLEYLSGIKQYILPDFRRLSKIRGVLDNSFNKSSMADHLEDFKPHIVHIHAYVHFGVGALQALLEYKRKSGCRIVMTHHNYSYICSNDAFFNYHTNNICEKCLTEDTKTGVHILVNNCYSNRVGSWGKYLQKRGFRKIFGEDLIDAHITPSAFLRDKLLRYDSTMNVTTIQNPCLERVLDELPKKTPGKIVYFGRISREKNVLAAAEAMIGTPCNIHLTIIGSGPDENRLKSFLDEHKSENITFINEFMPPEKLYKAICDAEYFILPSIVYETAGIALIEALNLGMTPIVSNHGSMKEIIEQIGIGYTFDPKDIKLIIKAIDEAVACRESNEKMSVYTIRDFLKLYTEDSYLKKILALYNNQ